MKFIETRNGTLLRVASIEKFQPHFRTDGSLDFYRCIDKNDDEIGLVSAYLIDTARLNAMFVPNTIDGAMLVEFSWVLCEESNEHELEVHRHPIVAWMIDRSDSHVVPISPTLSAGDDVLHPGTGTTFAVEFGTKGKIFSRWHFISADFTIKGNEEAAIEEAKKILNAPSSST